MKQTRLRKAKAWDGNNGGNVPVETIQFEDTFTRANQQLQGNQTETGDLFWFTSKGPASSDYPSISSNNLVSVGGGYFLIGSKFIENLDVSMTINNAGSGTTNVADILARCRDLTSFYAFFVSASGSWEILRQLNGTTVSIASGYNKTGTVNIRGICNGTSLEMYDGNTMVLSVTDSNIDGGLVGGYVQGSSISIASISGGEL